MALHSESTEHLHKLLLHAKSGSDSSRGVLLERASMRLIQLTRLMLRNDFPRLKRWEETNDVYQDAVMRLYHSLESVHPESLRQFYGLAATQVRRTLIDLVRRHFGPHGLARNVETGLSSSQLICDAPQSGERPENLADWTRFHEVIDSLPEVELEAFSLVWYSGMSQKEAAEVLQISERTMIRRMNRARLFIFEAMAGNSPITDSAR